MTQTQKKQNVQQQREMNEEDRHRQTGEENRQFFFVEINGHWKSDQSKEILVHVRDVQNRKLRKI